MSTFTIRDLILQSGNSRLPYKRRTDERKLAVYWGQRKLLLTEIQFLTWYWDPHVIKNPIVVYAGASPGLHIPYLVDLFPEITIHCYDPRPFGIQATDKIHLYVQYFTNEDAQKWAGRNDVFFMSDIRTADYKGIQEAISDTEEAGEENERQIREDMSFQEEWVKIIKPVHSLLKFRLPYVLKAEERGNTTNYLDGVIFFQPWAPQTSTETRLVPIKNENGDYSYKEYSWLMYEEQLFYHNVIGRQSKTYINPITKNTEPISPPELENDYDSTAEAFILMNYVYRRTGEYPETNIINILSKQITDSINSHRPGQYTRSLSGLRQIQKTRVYK